MDAHENFIKIAYYLAKIDKILDVLDHECIVQNSQEIIDLMSPLDNCCQGCQNLSTGYDFYSFDVSHDCVYFEKPPKTCDF